MREIAEIVEFGRCGIGSRESTKGETPLLLGDPSCDYAATIICDLR